MSRTKARLGSRVRAERCSASIRAQFTRHTPALKWGLLSCALWILCGPSLADDGSELAPGANGAPFEGAGNRSFGERLDETSVLPRPLNMIELLEAILSHDGGPIVAIDDGYGTLNLNQDGSFDYTPHTGFSGDDGLSIADRGGEELLNLASATISASSAPVSKALVLLPFDEGSGSIASDVSGSGNNGTLEGGATFEADLQ